MRKVSQKELDKLRADGKTIKRQMGTAPVQKKAEAFTEDVPAAKKVNQSAVDPKTVKDLNALVDQHAATSSVVSQNSEVLKSLIQQLAKMTATLDSKPTAVNFKIERNRQGFMENIVATPIKAS